MNEDMKKATKSYYEKLIKEIKESNLSFQTKQIFEEIVEKDIQKLRM